MSDDGLESYDIEEPGDTSEEEAAATLVYDEEAENLVETFMDSEEGRRALHAISEMVRNDFKDDWEGTEDWRRRQASDWKLFTGDIPPKSYPFENCANGHVPIMLENLSRLLARLMGEIFGDWKHVFGVSKIAGTTTDDIAEVLSIHDNWQLRNEVPDFARQMERSVLAILAHGDTTCCSSYDEHREQNRHEVLTADEFFTPFTYVSTFPDYSDAPHTIRLHFYQRHELQAMREKWHDVDGVIARDAPEWERDPYLELRFETARTQHIEIPDTNRNAPYRVLQWCGWDQGLLPNQDRDRYIQVFVDESTGRILCLRIHEKADWRDRWRFERETFEYEQYTRAMEEHEAAAAVAEAAHGTPDGADVPRDPALVPPPLPTWMKKAGQKPKAAKKVPIYSFVHGTCIENLVGNLGLGYGRVQADFNRAANVTLNQFVDQATISNIPGGFHSDQVSMPRNFRFTPGKYWPVEGVNVDEVSQAFHHLQQPPANPQLMEFVKMNYEWGQSSMQAPSILSGDAGKSGETWRGLQARIEQATKQLSWFAQKYCQNFLRYVLVNNADLNALFLPEYQLKEMFNFYTGSNQQFPVKREMWRRNYQVEIVADLRFSTQVQKIAEADELVQLPQAVPALAGNLAFMYDVVKGALAARKRDDLIASMGQRPPAPQMFGQPSMGAPVAAPQQQQSPRSQGAGPNAKQGNGAA